jgi:magnesium transporter
VFAAVLMALVRRAGDVEMGIGEAVADVEQLVFSPQADDPAEVVYDLKREIGEARRALVPLLSAFPDLVAEQEDAQRETRTMRWLRRLDTVLTKVDRHLDAHDALLGDMLSVHLSRVSVRQNEDMRKISAWAAIIAVPTLIAGVYGMNFDHMPELHWLVGYPASILLMGAAAGLLHRLFKRSGWL